MRLFTILCCLVLAAACVDNSYYEREIGGEWFAQDWVRDGQPTGYNAYMKFTPADSTYTAVFVENVESGKYWIDGNRLYTHASGSEPIKVKIESMENDIMEIGMNRGGQSEKIIFGRKR